MKKLLLGIFITFLSACSLMGTNTPKERVKELINLSEKLKNEYYNKYINNIDYVLTETIEDNYVIGHLSNYGKVKYIGSKEELNKIIKVKLIKYENDIYLAEKI